MDFLKTTPPPNSEECIVVFNEFLLSGPKGEVTYSVRTGPASAWTDISKSWGDQYGKHHPCVSLLDADKLEGGPICWMFIRDLPKAFSLLRSSAVSDKMRAENCHLRTVLDNIRSVVEVAVR